MRRKRLISPRSLVLIALGVIAVNWTIAQKSPSKVEVGEPYIVYGDTDGQLIRLQGGSLLLTGSDYSLRSTDRGTTWFTQPPLPGHVLQLSDGSFYLLHPGTQAADRPDEYIGRRIRLDSFERLDVQTLPQWEDTLVSIPEAAAMTGDDGTDMPTPTIFGPIVQLDDETWLAANYGNFRGDTMPMEGFLATEGQKWFKYRSYLLASTDEGESWQYLSTIAYDGRTGQESFCEPDLIHFSNGELLAVMRTGRYAPLYQVRSLDGGKSWDQPESLHTLGLAPQLVLLPNGILVCSSGWRPLKKIPTMARGGPYFVADEDYRKRYRVDVGIDDPSSAAGDYVMFSVDKGRTWTQPIRIAEPLTSGYTRLAPTGTDSCLVLSQRWMIPGESNASVVEKRKHDPKWATNAKRILEARQIVVRP
jgi:hypothetical protein